MCDQLFLRSLTNTRGIHYHVHERPPPIGKTILFLLKYGAQLLFTEFIKLINNDKTKYSNYNKQFKISTTSINIGALVCSTRYSS